MFPNYSDYVAEEYRRFFMSSFVMLRFNGIAGDCMEFGCCGALTLSTAYHAGQHTGAPGRHLWACDSFQGLPQATSQFDEHPLWRSGNFSMSQKDFVAQCTRNGLPETAYTVVPGFFSETLSSLKTPNDIALEGGDPGWRPHVIRQQSNRQLSPSCNLRQQNSQWGKTI
jgi:hypothetical protein